MGATTAEYCTVGKYKDAREAFWELVEQAQYEYGHSPYSGTIGTKDSFVMIELPPRASLRKFIRKLYDKDDERIADKWGPMGCIEIPRSRWKSLLPREYERYRGKRGLKAYVFFGWVAI